MGVSDQFHSMVALSPGIKTPLPIKQEAGWAARRRSDALEKRKMPSSCRQWNGTAIHLSCCLQHSHYTDCAIPALQMNIK